MGFEPETIKLESGGQGNFLKFFQKEFYSKQGGYLREKNIFDTKKNIFGRFWKKWTPAGSNPTWVDLILPFQISHWKRGVLFQRLIFQGKKFFDAVFSHYWVFNSIEFDSKSFLERLYYDFLSKMRFWHGKKDSGRLFQIMADYGGINLPESAIIWNNPE